jgi:hypothetical protein
VFGIKDEAVCKLSPNYWFKSIPLWPNYPHNINLKMTEIPHLIREKVKDYLNAIYLSEWKSRMDIICDQYKRKTYFFNNHLYCNYRTSPVIVLYILEYNYRVYNREIEYKWDISNVYNRKMK